jgi:hypothetical protein
MTCGKNTTMKCLNGIGRESIIAGQEVIFVLLLEMRVLTLLSIILSHRDNRTFISHPKGWYLSVRFYVKFAQKCKDIAEDLSISGYGGASDIIKIKIREICRGVDYNFPYGWKHNVR